MKRSLLRIVSLITALLTLAAALAACDGNGGDPTTSEPAPSESVTTGEGTTATEGKIFDVKSDGTITVNQNGSTFEIQVPGSIDIFNLDAYAQPGEDIEWKVSAEITGRFYITDKKLPLNAGDNTYYLFCTDKTGQTTRYTLIIRKIGSCTISFEGISEVQTVEEGGFATEPETQPKKEGYIFVRWDYDFAVPVTHDITIMAVFEPTYYEITFDPRLGTMSSLKQRVAYGEEVVLETPVRTGYVFVGWYNGDEVVKSGVWTLNSDVTLVAKWTNRPFKVTIDPAGGMIDNKTDVIEFDAVYGEELILPTPVRPGFGFGGWFNGDKIFENGIFEYTEDLTLTAKWNERSATITFVENGGTGGNHTETVGYDAELPTPVRTGFTFGGWFSDENLTKEVTAVPQVEEPVRLYAWWTEEGKPTEFIFEFSGTTYKVTDRLDRTSTSLIPAYIGGWKTIDAVERENPNAGIVIVKKTITIKIDRTAQIEAIFTPKFSDDDTTLVYESSNPLIATVDANGVVTGVNADLGTCTITVTNPASGMTEFCFVAVLQDEKDPNASLSFAEPEVVLTIGDSKKLDVVYIPEYADDDRTLVFESSSEIIATVSETGVVTAVFLGECRITARTLDGRFSAVCVIKAINEKINDNPGIVLSDAEIAMNTGWVKTVTAVYTPKFAGGDTTVVWSSSSEAVASVENGIITALSAGSCTVTAQSADGEFKASVEVTVAQAGIFTDQDKMELEVGAKGEFRVTVVPDSEGGSTEVLYSSSDESVASVTGGVITALKAGACTISASTVDGKYSVSLSLTVAAPAPAFVINGSEGIEVSQSGTVWKLTVKEDLSFLQLGKIVTVRSGYSWILAKDVEMSEGIVNKAVSLPDTGIVRVYAYCHNEDDSFMETYVIEIEKELHYMIRLDPAGGELQGETTVDVIYGRPFVLPVPEKEGEVFDGWYSGQDRIIDGNYSFKSDLDLTAHWSAPEEEE